MKVNSLVEVRKEQKSHLVPSWVISGTLQRMVALKLNIILTSNH